MSVRWEHKFFQNGIRAKNLCLFLAGALILFSISLVSAQNDFNSEEDIDAGFFEKIKVWFRSLFSENKV